MDKTASQYLVPIASLMRMSRDYYDQDLAIPTLMHHEQELVIQMIKWINMVTRLN